MKRLGFRTAMAFAGALAIAPALQAQEAPPSDRRDPTIVVTGQPLRDDAARRIVDRISVSRDGQLARFRAPVCPTVSGFDEPYAGMVARRMRRIAQEVGARVGDSDCQPNLFLVIVDDGPGFARELLRTNPTLFRGLNGEEMRRLTDEQGPARSWSITMVRDGYGRPMSEAPATGGGGLVDRGTGANPRIAGGLSVMRVYEGSVVNPTTAQTIEQSYVVLETGAVMGKDLMQVADYAALRGLAITRPELEGSEGTILSLFEARPATHPRRLTALDRGYLMGLYRSPATRGSEDQRNAIARAIVRETTGNQ